MMSIGIEIEQGYCEFAAGRMEQKDLFPPGWAREATVLAEEDGSPDLFVDL